MAEKIGGPGYDDYRTRGNLAFLFGSLLILFSWINVFLRSLGVLTEPISTVGGGLGAALFLIGLIYRFDLPNIYRRLAELEERLGRRIDALSKGHGGNGQDSPGSA